MWKILEISNFIFCEFNFIFVLVLHVFHVFYVFSDCLCLCETHAKFLFCFLFFFLICVCLVMTFFFSQTYRRTIEIFGESVPQTLLQVWILANGQLNSNDLNDLYLSIITSVLNLFINFVRFYRESKFNGMLVGEYALSVLQLSAVPIVKLIPRLGSISKGHVSHVNFSSFIFDRESFAPLLNALQNKACKLESMKLSIGSLVKLDNESCRLLGRILHDNFIQIQISKTVNSHEVQALFNKMDTNNNGYLKEENFLEAISNLNTSVQMTQLTMKHKRRIFQQMAIRRPNKRDKVYFYDFYNASFALNRGKGKKRAFDITQLDHPIHGIVQETILLIKSIHDNNNNNNNNSLNNNNNNIDETVALESKFDNLWKLYHLSVSGNLLNEYSQPRNNNIFFTFVDAFNEINKYKQRSKIKLPNRNIATQLKLIELFLWELFDTIIKERTFTDDCVNILNQRNNLFSQGELIRKEILENGMKRKLVSDLMSMDYSGLNIFEYCFAFTEHVHKDSKTGVHETLTLENIR